MVGRLLGLEKVLVIAFSRFFGIHRRIACWGSLLDGGGACHVMMIGLCAFLATTPSWFEKCGLNCQMKDPLVSQ